MSNDPRQVKESDAPGSPELFALPIAGMPKIIEHGKTGMLMVLVAGGKFLAGDGKFEVELPAFYMGMHAVTNREYGVFVRESGHPAPDQDSSSVWKGGKYPEEKGDHPVVCVSWDDARAYCGWAGLRLPSELEWEKACRWEDGRKYPWGEEWDERKCRNDKNNGSEQMAGVWNYAGGSSPAGPYQMSGNVWEWCEDWYEKEAYDRYKGDDLKPPKSGTHRVLRGGSWLNGNPGYFTASHRLSLTPSYRGYNYGFRCVMSTDVSPPALASFESLGA